MTRTRWTILAVVLLAAVVLFVLPDLGPFQKLNCTIDSHDPVAGRSRHERFLLGFHLRDEVTESAFTALYRELIGEPPPPRWRQHSLRTPWARACGDIQPVAAGREIVMAFQAAEFTPDAEQAALRHYLELIERAGPQGRFEDAALYASELFTFACSRNGRKISADMLASAGATTQPGATTRSTGLTASRPGG